MLVMIDADDANFFFSSESEWVNIRGGGVDVDDASEMGNFGQQMAGRPISKMAHIA